MNKHQKPKDFIPNIRIEPKMITAWLKRNMNKEPSTMLRHTARESLNRINYMNEYDRIKGILAHSVTHRHVDHNRLLNRQAELKQLYNESVSPTKHEITKK